MERGTPLPERGTPRAITVVDRTEIPSIKPSTPTTFGDVDYHRWRRERLAGRYLCVEFEGVDVTTSAEFASDVKGYVVLNCRDEVGHTWERQDGRLHLATVTVPGGEQRVCRHLLKGHVVIVARPVVE